MSVSFFGFAIVRSDELRDLRSLAALAEGDAREHPQDDTRRGAGERLGDPGGGPFAAVREVIRLADGLLDLTENGATSQQASTVLRWVEARTKSLLAACEVVRFEEVGSFDPSRHEAVAGRAAPSPELRNQIADTVRPGYAWRGALVRPQQVVVYVPADQTCGS